VTTYTPEVRQRLPDLSKPLKSWLVRRVWQNSPTANEPRSDGLFRRNPGHLVGGEPDRGPNAHPYVGTYVAKVEGKLRPVCSGTLISPKVFLTAGHCTQFDVERNLPVYVSFDPTYKPGASKLIKATPTSTRRPGLWSLRPATSATT
jgi:hypothetical protein